jgi:16S rRNA C1402 (ribose-2'-O) methylase RsmI
VKTLEDFIQYFGAERQCSVGRELTKMFEEHMRGTLQEVCEHFREKGVKGEIVITVAGAEVVRKKGRVRAEEEEEEGPEEEEEVGEE